MVGTQMSRRVVTQQHPRTDPHALNSARTFSSRNFKYGNMSEPRSTSMMYSQQAPAFEARNACLGVKTNSTPDSPPHEEKPDFVRLCEAKKAIIANLPTRCSHCNAPLTPDMCVELKGGDIVAYCKTKGACGKSLVLFAAVDITYPIYKKFCPFQKAEMTPATSNYSEGEQSGAREAEQMRPQNDSTIRMEILPGVFEQVDVYDLHGVTRPDAKCALCNRPYSAHEQGCDQHGWKEVRRGLYTLPDDWPEYDARQGKWVTRSNFWRFINRLVS